MLRLSLTLTASMCLAAAAMAHGGCQDNSALLQTSYEVFKQASTPKSPFHLAAPGSDADPASLIMPGTPMQVFRTIVFLCSCVAAVLAYFRVDLARSKAHDEGVLRQFQILESLAHMDQGDGAAPAVHGRGTSERDAKSESDRDTAVEACAKSDSTDTCTDTDVDTDSEDEMYDGHSLGEVAQPASP